RRGDPPGDLVVAVLTPPPLDSGLLTKGIGISLGSKYPKWSHHELSTAPGSRAFQTAARNFSTTWAERSLAMCVGPARGGPRPAPTTRCFGRLARALDSWRRGPRAAPLFSHHADRRGVAGVQTTGGIQLKSSPGTPAHGSHERSPEQRTLRL